MTIKNYSRNILQKTKKGTTNKSDEVGHHPTSLHFLPPLGVNFTIHQGPSLRKKRGGWKSKETGTKLQRSDRGTLSTTFYSLRSRWLQKKKKPSTPFEKCRWKKKGVVVKCDGFYKERGDGYPVTLSPYTKSSYISRWAKRGKGKGRFLYCGMDLRKEGKLFHPSFERKGQ
jgi:hypothetical protein